MIALARTLGRVPSLAWYIAATIIGGPWVVRYFLAVLGQGCGWLLPEVGR